MNFDIRDFYGKRLIFNDFSNESKVFLNCKGVFSMEKVCVKCINSVKL